MQTLFWTFSSFMIVLTILSAIGGGIRYRENFMDEILDDMYDEVVDVSPNVERAITNSHLMNTILEEEEEHVKGKSDDRIPPHQAVTPKGNIPTGVKTELSLNAKVIEAFNGNVYATF